MDRRVFFKGEGQIQSRIIISLNHSDDRDSDPETALHCPVDLLRCGVSPIQKVEDLPRHGPLETIDNISWDELLHHHRRLSQFQEDLLHRLDRDCRCLRTPDQINQRDEMGRSIPVADQHLLWTGSFRQSKDIEIGGIAGKDRPSRAEAIQSLKKFFLRFRNFRYCLYDQVSLLCYLEGSGGMDSAQNLWNQSRTDYLPIFQGPKIGLNQFEAFPENVLIHIHQIDFVTALCKDQGNGVAHGPCTDNQYPSDPIDIHYFPHHESLKY